MSTRTRIAKSASPLPARRIPAAVHEADRRVREMVEGARAEAARISSEAEAARTRVLAEAAEEGRRQGWARAGAILAAVAEERDRCLLDAEREVVSLALAVARKVLGRELAEPSRNAVIELAAHAIQGARHRRHVTLRVSPDDVGAVRAAEGRIGALLAHGALHVHEDSSLSPGDVVVETESGRIDARVETQLAALARQLEDIAT